MSFFSSLSVLSFISLSPFLLSSSTYACNLCGRVSVFFFS
jgi:hypothetical protein